MKKLLAMALVLILLPVLFPADQPEDETFQLKNGRYWILMNSYQRTAFLLGMLDGWKLRGYTEELIKGSSFNAFTAGGRFTGTDMAEMITSIYAERENIGLPVGWVALGCLAVQRGETSRDTVLTALRKHMGSLLSGPRSRPNTDFDPMSVIVALRPPK